jgi:putative transposase
LLTKATRRLKRNQRKLARKKKGSKNRDRAKLDVARAYARVTNIKTNYYHNLSRWLVENYDAIYMEDLNVKGMIKNRRLSRAIHEASWGELYRMIGYKSSWYGRTFHKIDRWTPTSKTCNFCGHKLAELDLSIRESDCPSCGTHHDRDVNADKNIINTGQMDVYDELSPHATGGVGNSIIPVALQKMASKIERSGDYCRLAMGVANQNDTMSLGI